MRLTDKQLKRFTEKFEIKAKSIIMIEMFQLKNYLLTWKKN